MPIRVSLLQIISGLMRLDLKKLELGNVSHFGGISQSVIQVYYQTKQLVVKLRIPGVSAESLKVYYKDNKLSIYSLFFSDSHDTTVDIPLHYHSIITKKWISLKHTIAICKGNQLEVIAPYSQTGESDSIEKIPILSLN